METSGITAALPAQDVVRARHFYLEKVGLQALESPSLEARDGQVGLIVGDGTNWLGEGAWFKDSEGNLVGLVPGLSGGHGA